MATERVVVVGDAHLGSADPADEAAFREFLATVPSLGTRLVLMGDLFDFWFEYGSVIPRRPFKTLAALARLVETGTKVEVFGGNHDRWGGTFWSEDLGIPFHPDGADLDLAGRRAWVHHGDGLAEQKLGGKVIHRVTRSPVTIAMFRLLHPTLGFKVADWLSATTGEKNKSGAGMDASAEAQERYARGVMAARPELGLILLAHTHRQRLIEVEPGRFYLNAGQWMVERQYAVVSGGVVWVGAWPARPVPTP